MKEKEGSKIRFVSVRVLYCVLAVSLFGVPTPEPHSCDRQIRKAVKTVTEQSPLESNQVWINEMLQRFNTLDSNEFVYMARARSSRLVLSFPSGEDILVIWLLSGLYDNIEMKSKLCFSNLELSKRVPSSKPIVAVCNENVRVTEMDVGPINSFH